MTTKTETLHAGAFLVSEANGTLSRATATVRSGQTLVAGQVVQFFSDGVQELIAYLDDTDGTEAAGIMFDAVDASLGAVAGAVYINQDAEVRLADLTFLGGTQSAAVASLLLLGIKTR